jgi:preprotein translocase subunit SecD
MLCFYLGYIDNGMNMKARLFLFNNILLAAAILSAGCGTHKLSSKKVYTTLTIFMEGRPGDGSLEQIGWAKTPIYLGNVVLTEDDVSKATLVDNADGSYDIQLEFTGHGALVLETQTATQRGKRLAIFAKFPPKGSKPETEEDATGTGETPKPAQPRIKAWLAAVTIPQNGFTTGSLRFKPEASHQEAERIVTGLNNLLTAMHKMEN